MYYDSLKIGYTSYSYNKPGRKRCTLTCICNENSISRVFQPIGLSFHYNFVLFLFSFSFDYSFSDLFSIFCILVLKENVLLSGAFFSKCQCKVALNSEVISSVNLLDFRISLIGFFFSFNNFTLSGMFFL